MLITVFYYDCQIKLYKLALNPLNFTLLYFFPIFLSVGKLENYEKLEKKNNKKMI